MEKKYFSIRDSKSEIFSTPFLQHSHAEAERTLAHLSQDKNSQISQFPEDFDLYFLGTFDDVKGTAVFLDSPQHVLKAIHVARNN